MSKQFRFKINVECDVQNAESESIARTAAFALLTQMQSVTKRGRPSSDVKATITGVSIDQPKYQSVTFREASLMVPRSIDDSQTVDVTERDQ